MQVAVYFVHQMWLDSRALVQSVHVLSDDGTKLAALVQLHQGFVTIIRQRVVAKPSHAVFP